MRAFQEGIASITHLTAVICDEQGRPVFGPSGPSEAWRLLESTSAGRNRLTKLLRSLTSDPYSQPDTALAFKAAAIVLEGHKLGAIVIGGLPRGKLTHAQIQNLAAEFGLSSEDSQRLALALRPWPSREQQDAQKLARLMASVIGQLARQASELEHVETELGTVHSLASMLAGTQDLQSILDTIARQVCEVTQVKACSIRLLEERTGELVIKAVHNLSPDYLAKGRIILKENPIDRAAFDGEVVFVEDAATDPRIKFRKQARREGIVSGLSVGMTYRGETIGVLRVYTDRPHRFDAHETALLRSISSQAAAAIIHSRLYLEALSAERYQRQLNYAGEIQRRMIPAAAPDYAGIEFAFVYEPSLGVGGDFFDFLEFRDSDEIGVCIADVVGKGIPAALLMASLRTAFRLYAFSTLEPTETMTMTNIHLCRETLVSEFATLFYCVFSSNGRKMTYCNAGHDPPILCRAGQIRYLEEAGFVLGVSPGESYDKKTVALKSGDALVFYTDGVVDAENFRGETFGRACLAESVAKHATKSASLLAQNLIWDVRRFVGLADQADDITLVVAKIVPRGS